MKKATVLFLAVLATLALTCPLFAAGESPESSTSAEMGAIHASSSLSADEITGMTVISQEGEELGKIKEVKLDAKTGNINYVILSKGGILGMGKENIAVPLEAFEFSPETHQATLIVDRSKLDNAPQQAGMSDEKFTSELHSHYGVSPAWPREEKREMAPEPEQKPEGESQY